MYWDGNVNTGTITITALVDPNDLVVEYNEANNKASTTITIANLPPNCLNAQPSVSVLWPPNHIMKDVEITSVTDPDGDKVSIVVDRVSQDEPTNGLGDGDTCPDAITQASSSVAEIRAERKGNGTGRVNHLHFIAYDDNLCRSRDASATFVS